MNTTQSLDYQINRLGFWSAIVAIATGVVSAFLPLDIPDGYSAEHVDRVAWLSENRGAFIAGWVNQIVAMLSLSGVFLAIAWKVAVNNKLRAILAAMVVLMSVMAFIIPKFIAVWTIPILAETISSGAAGADLATALLPLLNVSIPFSLYTSFDYLGFWLYSMFALLVAMPLYGKTLTAKISSVSLAVFGIVYQFLLVALWLGGITPEEIGLYFMSASGLLLVVVITMAINFKTAIASGS